MGYSKRKHNTRSYKKAPMYIRRIKGLNGPRFRPRTLFSKLTGNKAYSFSRYASTKLSIPLNSTAEISQSYAMRFNDITNYSEFTTLFDQYMITGVKWYIRLITNPDNSSGTISGPPTTTYPVLWSVVDLDDDSVMALSTIREKEGVKRAIMRPNATITRYVKLPRVSNEVYNTGVSSGYAVGKPMWIDCNSAAIPHYGIKFCIDAEGQTTQNYNIQIERKYYFKLKGVQ